jgi:hypothetical protein
MKEELLICSCHSTEHQIVLLESEYETDRYIYVHIHLNKRSFWQRLVYGIKYIFGYQCKYGAFDEMILDETHVPKLKAATSFLEQQPINR